MYLQKVHSSKQTPLQICKLVSQPIHPYHQPASSIKFCNQLICTQPLTTAKWPQQTMKMQQHWSPRSDKNVDYKRKKWKPAGFLVMDYNDIMIERRHQTASTTYVPVKDHSKVEYILTSHDHTVSQTPHFIAVGIASRKSQTFLSISLMQVPILWIATHPSRCNVFHRTTNSQCYGWFFRSFSNITEPFSNRASSCNFLVLSATSVDVGTHLLSCLLFLQKRKANNNTQQRLGKLEITNPIMEKFIITMLG